MKIKYLILAILMPFVLMSQDEHVEVVAPASIQSYTTITTNLNVNILGNINLDHFEWDILGNGSKIISTAQGNLSYNYNSAGSYVVKVAAIDVTGQKYYASITLFVSNGNGTQTILSPNTLKYNSLKSDKEIVFDGVKNNYALIVNGANSNDKIYSQSKNSINSIYSSLKTKGYTDDKIYWLDNSNIPNGVNKNISNMSTFQASIDDIEKKIDGDDNLFLWIEDHGYGYKNPSIFENTNDPEDAFRSGEISTRVNTSKHDMLEQNVKLKLFDPKTMDIPLNGTNLNTSFSQVGYPNDFIDFVRFSGLDKWFLKKMLFVDASGIQKVKLYRAKYTSHFSYMKNDGTSITDSDPYIELVIDYPKIDSDIDGIILKSEYDTWKANNYDNAFSYNTSAKLATFQININDENKWQHAYTVLKDDIDWNNENWGYNLYINVDGNMSETLMFDKNLDNKLDIAFVPQWVQAKNITTTQLIVVGTDNDNDGIIDGIDFNQNGSLTDNVGFDEEIHLSNDALHSNDLAKKLDELPCKFMTIGIMSCFSGGFIQDCSGYGRVVLTGSQKYYWGHTGDFSTYATAFADINNKTILQYYNSAYIKDWSNQHYHMYDDNGDGLGQNSIISVIAGDGCLGSKLTLTGLNETQNLQGIINSNQIISSPNVNATNVTVKSPATLIIEAVNSTLLNFTVENGATLIIDNNINNECN